MRNTALAGALVAMTAVWGWSFVVVRDAISGYSVLGFLAIRFAIASVVLSFFSAKRLTWRTIRVGGGIGLVLALGFVLQTFGLRYTTASNSGLITGLFVVFTPIADRLFFGRSPRRATVVTVVAGLAGMALLTGQSPSELRFGDGLTLLCAAAFGLHIALLSQYSASHDAGALTLVQVASCAIVFSMSWLAVEPVTMPPRETWFALGLTGIVASALAFTVQTAAQQRLSAARTAIIITTEPMFAAIFGHLLGGDRLLPVQYLGGVLILGAVVFSEVVPQLRGRLARAVA
ncbi:DMT family transporter [Candidatus Poribacteria bacterium]|nr:DMT family transporter [Candidatus Poribacteria bacterium]